MRRHVRKVSNVEMENYFEFLESTAVARTLIGGGGVYSYIMFCPTSFFSNQIQIYQFEKKLVGQNMNI